MEIDPMGPRDLAATIRRRGCDLNQFAARAQPEIGPQVVGGGGGVVVVVVEISKAEIAKQTGAELN